MDDDSQWKNVVNLKKYKRNEKRRIKKEEYEKWKNLMERCPHILTSSKVECIVQQFKIDNLKNKLLSEGWIEYQL